ncbi:hypothetical protein M1403_00815 [Patescibacteria group bacterium]|nr:hypothetical protein [Patescibacteria group bacterium]
METIELEKGGFLKRYLFPEIDTLLADLDRPMDEDQEFELEASLALAAVKPGAIVLGPVFANRLIKDQKKIAKPDGFLFSRQPGERLQLEAFLESKNGRKVNGNDVEYKNRGLANLLRRLRKEPGSLSTRLRHILGYEDEEFVPVPAQVLIPETSRVKLILARPRGKGIDVTDRLTANLPLPMEYLNVDVNKGTRMRFDFRAR